MMKLIPQNKSNNPEKQMIKGKEERGFPWRRPLEGENGEETFPLHVLKIEEEYTQHITRWTNRSGKLNWWSMNSKNFQLTQS